MAYWMEQEELQVNISLNLLEDLHTSDRTHRYPEINSLDPSGKKILI